MIHHQSIFERWPLANESVQAIITSPPYWGLRKYDIPDIVIGGDSACVHQWEDIITPAKGGRNTPENPSKIGNNRAVQDDASLSPRFGSKSNHCLLCGAWRGQYGLEPSYKDYVAHTVLWAKEAWRVLRDDGIFFLNLGDSYSSYKDCKQVAQSCAKGTPSENAHVLGKGDSPTRDTKRLKADRLPDKSKVLIPYRVAIALMDDDSNDIYELDKRFILCNNITITEDIANAIQRQRERETIPQRVCTEVAGSKPKALPSNRKRMEKKESRKDETIQGEILLGEQRKRNHPLCQEQYETPQ